MAGACPELRPKDFFYNASWQVLEERKDASACCQYVWSARYIDAPVLRDRNNDQAPDLEERLYYTTDANMNVTALVGTDGAVVERYTYDPYGKVTLRDGSWNALTWNQSKQNEVLYCGYRFDSETGLYHVRRRPYHPTVGRWVSRDPMGYADGMSLYGYARSRPLNFSDPSGLHGPPPWMGPHFDYEGRRLRTVRIFHTEDIDATTTEYWRESDPGPCDELHASQLADKWEFKNTRRSVTVEVLKAPGSSYGEHAKPPRVSSLGLQVVRTWLQGDVVKSRVLCRCDCWRRDPSRDPLVNPSTDKPQPGGWVADYCWWETLHSQTLGNNVVLRVDSVWQHTWVQWWVELYRPPLPPPLVEA